MILSPPTDTDKGIANLEIEDLRKDSQVLENGKGEGHTLPHHHLHHIFHPGRLVDNDNENKRR